MKRIKVIKNKDVCRNPFTDTKMTMKLVKVFNEPTSVGHLKFRNNHLYYMKRNSSDHTLYLYFKHPDYNDNVDFNKYRKLCGLMLPNQIKKLRCQYHLSTRELGAILGISHATISNIENNNQMQSTAQDTILRMLLNPMVMAKLIKQHLPLIKLRRPRHVQINSLINKSHAIAKVTHLN